MMLANFKIKHFKAWDSIDPEIKYLDTKSQ